MKQYKSPQITGNNIFLVCFHMAFRVDNLILCIKTKLKFKMNSKEKTKNIHRNVCSTCLPG